MLGFSMFHASSGSFRHTGELHNPMPNRIDATRILGDAVCCVCE